MGIYEKLLKVQTELKAPKGQYNDFGNYSYRSCEDIQEGVKPFLKELGAVLITGDELVLIGDRHYIKATARFIDTESGESVQNTAYARETEAKKGMDASQITGSASSYARKYALNGLFCIDDVKDADTTDNNATTKGRADRGTQDKITQKEADVICNLLEKYKLNPNQVFNVPVENLTKKQYGQALEELKKLKK